MPETAVVDEAQSDCCLGALSDWVNNAQQGTGVVESRSVSDTVCNEAPVESLDQAGSCKLWLECRLALGLVAQGTLGTSNGDACKRQSE
tara:strand:- start:624 stop:890 length:267 start_codon:yes stop_codon:yes gene_type:complete